LYRRCLRFLAASALCLGVFTQTCAAGTLPAARITLGDEVFLQQTWQDLHGRCVGVITNQTGVTSRLVNIVDLVDG